MSSQDVVLTGLDISGVEVLCGEFMRLGLKRELPRFSRQLSPSYWTSGKCIEAGIWRFIGNGQLRPTSTQSDFILTAGPLRKQPKEQRNGLRPPREL